MGIDPLAHDIRFVEDDWESPTLGAWGLGWEVWLDGMEITQFTYFQQAGGIDLKPVSGEITYGLERIAMYLQGVDNVFDLKWAEGVTYGDVHKRNEIEQSGYNFDEADKAMLFKLFDMYEAESKRLAGKGLSLRLMITVSSVLIRSTSLTQRGAISVAERTSFIGRVRALARSTAQIYLKTREDMGFPLLKRDAQNAAQEGGGRV